MPNDFALVWKLASKGVETLVESKVNALLMPTFKLALVLSRVLSVGLKASCTSNFTKKYDELARRRGNLRATASEGLSSSDNLRVPIYEENASKVNRFSHDSRSTCASGYKAHMLVRRGTLMISLLT
jgi:hypothetical protein